MIRRLAASIQLYQTERTEISSAFCNGLIVILSPSPFHSNKDRMNEKPDRPCSSLRLLLVKQADVYKWLE